MEWKWHALQRPVTKLALADSIAAKVVSPILKRLGENKHSEEYIVNSRRSSALAKYILICHETVRFVRFVVIKAGRGIAEKWAGV